MSGYIRSSAPCLPDGRSKEQREPAQLCFCKNVDDELQLTNLAMDPICQAQIYICTVAKKSEAYNPCACIILYAIFSRLRLYSGGKPEEK